MKKNSFILAGFLIISLIFTSNSIFAQDRDYNIQDVYSIPTTSVKSQDRAGTCWAYATISFLEAEALRETGTEFDFSEIFVVRNAYQTKAENYVMRHGKANFSQGGQAHDVINEIKKHGLLSEKDYKGIMYDSEVHNHSELEAVLSGMLNGIIKNRGKKLTDVWMDAINAVLDVYLGEVPEADADAYWKSTKLDTDDYIEFTSYSNYAYYEECQLQIPDNWSNDLYYNLPLEDLMAVMDNALEKGYTICWDGDVSEKGFNFSSAIANIPDNNSKSPATDTEQGDEIKVTQENRQIRFNNYSSTDDHLMHLTDLAKDESTGKLYYKIKNSWGTDRNDAKGYLYMSEAYVRMHTVAIMVHKNVVPKEIAKKLK